VLVTVLYILWSIIPVAVAILFAFNNGRSRTTWQGFSFKWFTGSVGSVFHDKTGVSQALCQTSRKLRIILNQQDSNRRLPYS